MSGANDAYSLLNHLRKDVIIYVRKSAGNDDPALSKYFVYSGSLQETRLGGCGLAEP